MCVQSFKRFLIFQCYCLITVVDNDRLSTLAK